MRVRISKSIQKSGDHWNWSVHAHMTLFGSGRGSAASFAEAEQQAEYYIRTAFAV